jgi:hypothetical protein
MVDNSEAGANHSALIPSVPTMMNASTTHLKLEAEFLSSAILSCFPQDRKQYTSLKIFTRMP